MEKVVTVSNLISTILLDMRANKVDVLGKSRWGKIKGFVYLYLFSQQFECVLRFRINNYLSKKGLRYLSLRMSRNRALKFGNDISYMAEIGPGLRIVHLPDVVIGGFVRAGENLVLLNGVTLGQKSVNAGDKNGMPKIGNNVFIGTGSKLLGDITVGDGVTIGALTFCNKDVPEGAVAFGTPMKISYPQAA